MTPHAQVIFEPHQFHNIKEIKKSNRKNREKIWWCNDCNVRCWEHGEEFKKYFEYKDCSEYELDNCVKFLEHIIEIYDTPNFSYLIEEIEERLKEIKEILQENKLPILYKKPKNIKENEENY